MKKDIILLSISAAVLVGALLVPKALGIIKIILFIAAFLLSGFKVLANAFKGIIKGNIFNENTLMAVAAIGAFFIKEYPEAIFVMIFYRVGELFEDYAVGKSRKSIKEVMNICPDYANLLKDGKTVRVDPEDIEIGDLITVAAGEKIPLDGVVVSGGSYIDTRALTGESVPRRVDADDTVLSGCINCEGVLTIRVTKTFEDSTVSKILELVENASARKSTSEKFITKFAKYYTPCVLVAALLLAVLPPLLIEGATFSDYVYRALSFLVVSCPCALVISVPLSFFGGIGGCAKQGILIKGGSYLEMLSKADTAVFDKTGTLTKGVFEVQQINPENCTADELLRFAAYAENISSHPVAKSVISAYGNQLDVSLVTDAKEIAGHGVSAVVEGKTVLAGNAKLMQMHNIEFTEASGGTVIYVAVDNGFKGSIIIADELKADAKNLVAQLKKSGIGNTVMLTGDIKSAAEKTAAETGIDTVYSDLLPGDKVNILEKVMSSAKGKTVYVGDGINDAPVLARADVGIAMGALGSDAAIEAADIVIMTDEPSKIITAVKTAKRTISIAKQNIIFSIAIKLGILVLCSLNVVGIGVAVFGDVGVMVLAVLNSFRALSTKER
ncbi:MAG: cadmium-translocating P-type ATPase [Clostridia bacterium]|nr:cadmium-translocating P-type ATPase [Clostridia bacterium]